MFQDRIDAGGKLTNKLQQYKDQKNVIIIGLPRGGVPVAYEISKNLHLPLDIVCPRKIGAPGNKEFAIGAITETGEGIFNWQVINRLDISKEYIENEVKAESQEAQNRLNIYRKKMPSRDLNNKVVIIVDDGLATGSTMKAAIQSIKLEGAAKIIVAIPVSPPDTLKEIRAIVDEVICLDAPSFFQAVGQFYADFSPTKDQEVITLMELSNRE